MLHFIDVDITDKIFNLSMYVRKINSKLREMFKLGWKEELFNDDRKGGFGNKLRTYRKYKTAFRTEDYLLKSSPSNLKSIARFRLSSHRLNIESLRYVKPRIEPQNCLCTYCNLKECEDEYHFLIRCGKYATSRKTFFQKVTMLYNNNFSTLTECDKFIWLCSNIDENIIKLLGIFIGECFLIRK